MRARKIKELKGDLKGCERAWSRNTKIVIAFNVTYRDGLYVRLKNRHNNKLLGLRFQKHEDKCGCNFLQKLAEISVKSKIAPEKRGL